jgi:hypothetical protein
MRAAASRTACAWCVFTIAIASLRSGPAGNFFKAAVISIARTISVGCFNAQRARGRATEESFLLPKLMTTAILTSEIG